MEDDYLWELGTRFPGNWVVAATITKNGNCISGVSVSAVPPNGTKVYHAVYKHGTQCDDPASLASVKRINFSRKASPAKRDGVQTGGPESVCANLFNGSLSIGSGPNPPACSR